MHTVEALKPTDVLVLMMVASSHTLSFICVQFIIVLLSYSNVVMEKCVQILLHLFSIQFFLDQSFPP